MKRFLDVLRLALISPEAMCIGLLSLGLVLMPQMYSVIGVILRANTDVWKYTITIPLTLLGTSGKFSRQILFPHNNNRVLLEWEGYNRLKDRAYFSVAVCLVCSLLALLIWIFQAAIPLSWLTALGAVAWFVPVVTTATAYMATFKVREVLERYR